MSRLEITDIGLGIKKIGRTQLSDSRGSFTRLFCANELSAVGWTESIAQSNWAESKDRGTVRGLHYQTAPFAEAKILLCMSGEIHDVAVDVRRGSNSLLHHVAINLSAERGEGILIPAGFAHGYQCLSVDVRVLYFHSGAYTPSAERGLNSLDPRLKIAWPLPVENRSNRDQNHPLLDEWFNGDQF